MARSLLANIATLGLGQA